MYTLTQGRTVYAKGCFLIFESLFSLLKLKYAQGVKIHIFANSYVKYEITRILEEVILSYYNKDYIVSSVKLNSAVCSHLYDSLSRIREFHLKLYSLNERLSNPSTKRKFSPVADVKKKRMRLHNNVASTETVTINKQQNDDDDILDS